MELPELPEMPDEIESALVPVDGVVEGLLPLVDHEKAQRLALAMVDRPDRSQEVVRRDDLEEWTYLTEIQAKQMIAEAYARQDDDAYRLLPYRCMVFWRTSRWLLSKANKIQQGQTLFEASEQNSSLFAEPMNVHISGYMNSIRAALVLARGNPCHPAFARDFSTARKVLSAHLLAASYLEISKGSQRDPMLGLQGLRGFDDLDQRAVDNVPSVAEILTFEQDLLGRVARVVYSTTRSNAIVWIKKRLGLTNPEVEELMKLVDRAIVRERRITPEEARAMLAQRLERLMHTARKGMNADLELKAMKMWGEIYGLKNSVAEDTNRSIVGASRE